MSGKPQRDNPKASIQLYVNSSVLVSVLSLLESETFRFSSRSQLIETIFFLSEHMYIEEPGNNFILNLLEVKSALLKTWINGGNHERRYIHLTLDKRTIDFLDMLKDKYDMLFRNRNDVAELLLGNASMFCDSPDKIRYFNSRLCDVLELHPHRTK